MRLKGINEFSDATICLLLLLFIAFHQKQRKCNVHMYHKLKFNHSACVNCFELFVFKKFVESSMVVSYGCVRLYMT